MPGLFPHAMLLSGPLFDHCVSDSKFQDQISCGVAVLVDEVVDCRVLELVEVDVLVLVLVLEEVVEVVDDVTGCTEEAEDVVVVEEVEEVVEEVVGAVVDDEVEVVDEVVEVVDEVVEVVDEVVDEVVEEVALDVVVVVEVELVEVGLTDAVEVAVEVVDDMVVELVDEVGLCAFPDWVEVVVVGLPTLVEVDELVSDALLDVVVPVTSWWHRSVTGGVPTVYSNGT